MNADTMLQDIAATIYELPLSAVRERQDYPTLSCPLDIAILLIDCDTEIAVNGILGFLENRTGAHLEATIRALLAIGASRDAARLAAIQEIMRKHEVTWEKLRADFEGTREFQISSFSKLHGQESFATAVCEADPVSIFQGPKEEDVYQLLCDYLDARLDHLNAEIKTRRA